MEYAVARLLVAMVFFILRSHLRDLHLGQSFLTSLLHILGTESQLQRPEGHIIKDGCAKELNIGVLKDESHLPMEMKSILSRRDSLDFVSQHVHRSRSGGVDPVENFEQG